jgi:hypothetical protein
LLGCIGCMNVVVVVPGAVSRQAAALGPSTTGVRGGAFRVGLAELDGSRAARP